MTEGEIRFRCLGRDQCRRHGGTWNRAKTACERGGQRRRPTVSEGDKVDSVVMSAPEFVTDCFVKIRQFETAGKSRRPKRMWVGVEERIRAALLLRWRRRSQSEASRKGAQTIGGIFSSKYFVRVWLSFRSLRWRPRWLQPFRTLQGGDSGGDNYSSCSATSRIHERRSTETARVARSRS